MEEVDRITYFNCVLSLIKDKNIRSFCQLLLNHANDYFFIEPASSSGKYHPKYSLGKGGLARHSIAVALVLNEILETDCYPFSDTEKDLLICAAIIHDIKKYGDGKAFTVKDHPELAGEYLVKEFDEYPLISKENVQYIYDAVLTHMGKFGKDVPLNDSQKLLHIADCLASRKYLNIDFNKVEKEGFEIVNTSIVRPNERPEDYVLNFGKYKGEKLGNVEYPYLDFLANKFEHKTHPVVEKAKRLLKEKYNFKYGKSYKNSCI